MKKVTFLNVYIAFFIITLITTAISCKKDNASKAFIVNDVSNQMLQMQLEKAKKNIVLAGLPLELISYSLDKIPTATELKKQILKKGNAIPYYDGIHKETFQMHTIGEVVKPAQIIIDGNQQITITNNGNFSSILDEVLPKAEKLASIEWLYKGEKITSLCAYNKDGVVYDNILSNLLIIQDNSENNSNEMQLDKNNPGILNYKSIVNAAVAATYSFTAAVKDYTITWITGGTRGKIVIKHYILWNGINRISDMGGTVDHWMTLGSTNARWARNLLVATSRSKMAWGYGWATPTASFSIKFNTSNLTFETGTSGVGSKGAGDGVHTIYLP